jgi:small-conductance mechanosensitive channel
MEYFIHIKQLLLDSFNELIQTINSYLPNLVSALALLLLGLILAGITRWIIIRLSDGLDRVVHVIGFTSIPVLKNWPIGVILGWLAYWLIILFFITSAVETIGLPGLANWLERLINNLPIYFVAIACIVVGVLIGNYIRDRIHAGARLSGMRHAEMLGSWLRIIIIIFAVITGLAQIGMDLSLVEQVLIILVTALVGSIALAFGLGAGPTLANVISGRYVRKIYQVGQKITINGVSGEILELLPTGVVLDTDAGRTFVPAKMFEDNASVLLDNEARDENV